MIRFFNAAVILFISSGASKHDYRSHRLHQLPFLRSAASADAIPDSVSFLCIFCRDKKIKDQIDTLFHQSEIVKTQFAV